MKRLLRKVAGVFVATAMVAAMGVTTLAADETENINGNNNVVGNNDPADAVKKKLVIEKELTAYNPEEIEIYAPNITYTYTIAGSDDEAGKKITDTHGTSAKTVAGPSGASITSSISWTNTEKINASSAGIANKKELTIDLSGINFQAAGVYRYKITETCSDTDKAAASVTEGTIAQVRYLDVYVRDPKAGTTETGFQIYGYVLFENNNDINANSVDSADDSVKKAVKTEGFVATTGPDGSTLSADSYYTYNVSVTKKLENDSANSTHEFPFQIDFAKAASGNFNLVASDTTDPVAMATSINRKIADGNSVKFSGIPCGTTVDIIETNDITTVAYKVTTTGADTNITDKLVNGNETTGDDAVVINSTAGQSGEFKKVTFTNTLELISPTGVAMAVLPFVILLGFGVCFMVVSTTKRSEEQA